MPSAPRIPFISQSNAKQLALLSWEKRRARAAAIAALPPACTESSPADPLKAAQLARTLKQIEIIDDLLDVAEDFRAWDALTRAKERLTKVWFHLGGIAGPGQLRPTSRSTGKRSRRSGPPAAADTQ